MLNKLVSPIGAILLFICIAGATAYLKSERTTENANNDSATAALFDTSFPDENDTPQTMSQWKGKIVVLNFWATWCPPCREEMPELSELHTEYQDKNVVVLGVAIDEVALIKEFTEETKVSYPLLSAEDDGMSLAASLGNNKGALPYTLIIKPDGSIANTYFGRITKPLLEKTLKTLL